MIQACLEGGAHHVDICGEPQFLETMQLKYNEAAREKGLYIVGACGFDSIPAEMGVLYTYQQFNGDLNSIECFLNVITGPDVRRKLILSRFFLFALFSHLFSFLIKFSEMLCEDYCFVGFNSILND